MSSRADVDTVMWNGCSFPNVAKVTASKRLFASLWEFRD